MFFWFTLDGKSHGFPLIPFCFLSYVAPIGAKPPSAEHAVTEQNSKSHGTEPASMSERKS